MKNLKLFLSSFILIISFITNAQDDTAPVLSLDEGPIDNQFEYVIKKSGNYNSANVSYEVVRRAWINKLRKNVIDTLIKSKAEATKLQAQINTQQNEISSLKSELSTTNSNLTQTSKEKDSISFFGSLVQKGFYKTIMWGIIAVLTILLLTFIYKFRNSNIITQEAKSGLADLEEEFEQHRRRSLEREQKLSRQLQDELNKQKLMKK
ncbi:tRNA (guanine-N1)-methyltransferase [Flavobacteriaceae bacterium R38]|nr:tRNA (guanine-N1)-methyltransferase [Flavobacteriaceae bacterium R38]